MSDNRAAYERKLAAQLDELPAELDKLEARLKQADADTRIRLQQELDALRGKGDAARSRLAALNEAGGDVA